MTSNLTNAKKRENGYIYEKKNTYVINYESKQ